MYTTTFKIIATSFWLIYLILAISINLIKFLNLHFNSEKLRKLNFMAMKEDPKIELSIYYIIVMATCGWIIGVCYKFIIAPLI